MSEQNTLLPNLKTNGRKEPVKNADLENLVKGVALLAAGILAASCVATELSFPGISVLRRNGAVRYRRSVSYEVL